MAMSSLASILNNRGKQSSLLKGVTGALVVEETNRQLIRIFGPEIVNHASAAYLRHTTLAIACLSTTAAQEIKLHERDLLAGIQAKIPLANITKIRYLS